MSSPTIPLNLAGDLTTVPTNTLRRRSMSNLLRMGHCAPTVMQTLLDASYTEAEWLVKLTAGLPGGIGNTGAECGGVTAPFRSLSAFAMLVTRCTTGCPVHRQRA